MAVVATVAARASAAGCGRRTAAVPNLWPAPALAPPPSRTSLGRQQPPALGRAGGGLAACGGGAAASGVASALLVVGAVGRRRAPQRGSKRRLGRAARSASSLPGAIVDWAGQAAEEDDAQLRHVVVDAARAARADPEAWAAVEASATSAMEAVEEKLRKESRSLRELVGPDAAGSIEESVAVGLSEGFSREDLRAGLRTPAVERAIGAVLKDGIFEFMQTVDLLGNVIGRLPILGPLRQQVIDGFRREVDRALGAQIDGFLGRYTRLAAEQTLLPFLTAEANRATLAQSARQLARYVLDRRVSELLPPAETAESLRRELLAGMRSLDVDTVGEGAHAARRLLRQRPDPSSNSSLHAVMKPLNAELDSQWRRFLVADGHADAGRHEQAEAAAADALESLAARRPELGLAGVAPERRRRLESKIAQALVEELELVSGA